MARIVSEASDSERIQAAIVLRAHGDFGLLREVVAPTGTGIDWRETLFRGGLSDEDWRERLDSEFGPPAP